MHVSMDGYRGSTDRLSCEGIVRSAVETYAEMLDIRGEPSINRIGDGYLGVIVTEKGHLTLQTFPQEGRGWLGILRINESFDYSRLEKEFAASFDFKSVSSKESGIGFPIYY